MRIFNRAQCGHPTRLLLLLLCLSQAGAVPPLGPMMKAMSVSKDAVGETGTRHGVLQERSRTKPTGIVRVMRIREPLLFESGGHRNSKGQRQVHPERTYTVVNIPIAGDPGDIEVECALCSGKQQTPKGERQEHMQYHPAGDGSEEKNEDEECCFIQGTVADCTHCNLDSVPTSLKNNITVLLLSNNAITEKALTPGVFGSYPHLKQLSLSANNISQLPERAFEGLGSLRCLCLWNNSIRLDGALNSSHVFQPLNRSLVYLKLNRNNRHTGYSDRVYPSYALGFLTSLKHLYLDGLFVKNFTNPDKKLRNLTHLTLAGFNEGFCTMVGIYPYGFDLDSLTHLNISDCFLNDERMSVYSFHNLVNLHTIDISNNFQLGLEKIRHYMHGQRNNKNLKILIMERIVPRFKPCVAILNQTLQWSSNTGLERIDASNNEIEIIEKGALAFLPKTLKTLNLKGNKIIFGSYFQDLSVMTSLISLNLDGSSVAYRFPNFFPDRRLDCKSPALATKLPPKRDSGSTSTPAPSTSLPVPPNLTHISMAGNGMDYTLTSITFASQNKLTHADLRYNRFQRLDGPIKGLDSLISLDISECFIETISPGFFDYFIQLQNLSLSKNLVGDCLASDFDGGTFRRLSQVQYLNLSLNNIYHLNGPVFYGLANIQVLDLSVNRLSQVNFSISHMKKLQYINLKANQVPSLKPQTRRDIDSLLKQNIPIKINLCENHVKCDCDNLDFLEWLVHTNVLDDDVLCYYCQYKTGLVKHVTGGYRPVVTTLRRECDRHKAVFVVAIGATMVAALTVLGVLAYRFRWTLRYWYHVAKLLVRSSRSAPSEDFEYDVFVSYNNKDDFVEEVLVPRLQNEFGLRVMIHGLDFPVGGLIADSIQQAVSKSRKTLVVITKNMLKSYWCNHEMMIARHEGISRGRSVLMFLFLEDISTSDLGHRVTSYIRESTYIAFPKDQHHENAFWRKLSNDIKADAPMA